MQTDHQPDQSKKAPIKVSFVMMITGSIVTALGLVMVSMYLYNTSRAAQLDLSLPGLQEERLRAQQAKRYDGFNATGKLDKAALEQFDKLYRQQRADIRQDADGFATTPLEDEQLEIKVE